MKSASDWAAKAGIRLADSHAVGRSDTIARALRAAYRRGAKVEREDCTAIAAMSVARSVSMKSEITPELIAKLRAKAENERELHELGNPDPDDCWATRTWIAAANPAAVVSLLNEIERLRGLVHEND